jgi:peptidoglycan/LPS O-acetylase OafA/YrhL
MTEVAPPVVPVASSPAVFTHNSSLDGLRAIAVLLVVVSHGSSLLLARDTRFAVGGIGVGIFFVLSGYLITSLLLRERANRGQISLRDFYMRRALRIWPLYYAVLLLYLVVLVHVHSRPGDSWVSTDSPKYAAFDHVWWSYLVFVQNYVSDLKHVNLGLGVYWSLAIEEQYYFVWPLILIALTRVRWRWAVPAFLVGATAVSFVLRALTAQHHLGSPGAGDIEWMAHTNIFGLAVGSLLAWSRFDRSQRAAPARGGGFGATVAWVVVAALVLSATIPAQHAGWAIKLPHAGYYQPLVLSVAVAAIIDYIAGGGSGWSPLQWWPMVYVGRVSYGMYLLHPLVLSVAMHALGGGWAAMGIYTLATVGVAASSYELFEKRILRLKRRFSHVPSIGTETGHSSRAAHSTAVSVSPRAI